jgi:flagellar biosynthesis GTPase FlhF
MPDVAILNNQVITVSDIYKFNIDKKSKFSCLNCNKELHFRQSRNGETNYTEHFYHPNNVKDTHIDCENTTLERIRDNDTWHNKISNFMDLEYREVIRTNNNIKHIVDAYDSLNDMGIEFQNSPISVESIQSRDATTYLDWIFNVENQYLRKVIIGNKIICEIPHDNWEQAVKAVKNSVYLYTGKKEWIILEDREAYHIEIENKIRNVWIGEPCSFQQIYDDTVLQNMLTEEGKTYFENTKTIIPSTQIMYARCKKSMYLLDDIHREYVYSHIFKPNDILAIKSVAGSGKTTTLLKLAGIHKTKKILYLAFNKALISEITTKIKKHNITNLYPVTFDKLLYTMYLTIKKREPTIVELSPQTIKNFIPWLNGKPFELRKRYVDLYRRFCRNHIHNDPKQYCDSINPFRKNKDDSFLSNLWYKSMNHQLVTFDSMRKLSVIQKWFKGTIDKMYDMIFIDETQDFDMMMLRMLLDDTTIPKVFVGDPKQSIYEWRGCINGFNHLPSSSLIIEFYSTFRVGDPACEFIREKFDDCWMISKSKNPTIISNDISLIKDKKYTYLFRTWRSLLTKAKEMENIWICNYDDQTEKMRKLHTVLTSFGGNIDDEEFADDLPMFLKTLTKEQLEDIITSIEKNITDKNNVVCKLYTIHAYKGLEDENVRICDDIDIDEDENLYYVALTRGMKNIIED